MPPFIDLTGQSFGRWSVLRRVQTAYTLCATWECRCVCGRTGIVQGGQLRGGFSTSCGCFNREVITSHGYSHAPREKKKTYDSWQAAKNRCFRKRDKDYPRWGGRGITMCARWANSFEAFLEDMGPCPPGTSIDRIDNNGNYEPGNCRWATALEQASNTRANRLITHDGRTQTLTAWARERGINPQTISERINRGWESPRLLETVRSW